MEESIRSKKSNADRGLESHVDPANPQGPRLSHCPKPNKSRKPVQPNHTPRSKTTATSTPKKTSKKSR